MKTTIDDLEKTYKLCLSTGNVKEKVVDIEAQILSELEKEQRELPQKIRDAQSASEEAQDALGAETPGDRGKRERAEMASEELQDLLSQLEQLGDDPVGLQTECLDVLGELVE